MAGGEQLDRLHRMTGKTPVAWLDRLKLVAVPGEPRRVPAFPDVAVVATVFSLATLGLSQTVRTPLSSAAYPRAPRAAGDGIAISVAVGQFSTDFGVGLPGIAEHVTRDLSPWPSWEPCPRRRIVYA